MTCATGCSMPLRTPLEALECVLAGGGDSAVGSPSGTLPVAAGGRRVGTLDCRADLAATGYSPALAQGLIYRLTKRTMTMFGSSERKLNSA